MKKHAASNSSSEHNAFLWTVSKTPGKHRYLANTCCKWPNTKPWNKAMECLEVSNWSFFTLSHTTATSSNRQHDCEGRGGHCKVFSSRVGKCGFSSVTSKSEGGTHSVFIPKNIAATSNHSDLHSTAKKHHQNRKRPKSWMQTILLHKVQRATWLGDKTQEKKGRLRT